MNASIYNTGLIRAVEQIKRACAPPPPNSERGRKRERFEHSYILQQEDRIYSILHRANVDEDSFFSLVEVAQHYMCASEIERFSTQSAFNGRWARRKPGEARAQIADDMEFIPRECARLLREAREHFSKGDRSGAAHYALCAIEIAAQKGIRIAALFELAGYDRAGSAKLGDLIQSAENKTPTTLLP